MKKIFDKLKAYPENERLFILKMLVPFVTNQSYESVFAADFLNITDEQKNKIAMLIDENMLQNKPWEYVLGYVEIFNINFKIVPPVLIPRPETEELIYNIFKMYAHLKFEPLKVLDIGTGSGFIALSIAKHFPSWQVTAVDIFDPALELAKTNAELNNIKNVTFIKSDIFENLQNQKFDLIVSNPPYISEFDYSSLEESVKEWESKLALVADNNGFEVIEKIVKNSPAHLTVNNKLSHLPRLIFETGHNHKDLILSLSRDFFEKVEVAKDMFGKDRFAYFFIRG